MSAMRRTLWSLAAVALLATLTPAARAEEESDKVRRARMENDLEKEAESTDAKCGTKLAVTIDWASFDADEAWKTRSVSGYCEAPLGALARLCEGKHAKEHIAKKVKKLACKAAKDKSAWRLEVKGDTLEWNVSPDAVNAGDFARNQLLRKL